MVTRQLIVVAVEWIETKLKRGTTLLGQGSTALDEVSMELVPSCSSLALN